MDKSGKKVESNPRTEKRDVLQEIVVLGVTRQRKSKLTIKEKEVQKLFGHMNVELQCLWGQMIKRLTDKQYRYVWAMVLSGKKVIIK